MFLHGNDVDILDDKNFSKNDINRRSKWFEKLLNQENEDHLVDFENEEECIIIKNLSKNMRVFVNDV